MLDYSTKTSHDGEPNSISVWHKAALELMSFKGRDILDIGCGSGGFLMHIKNSAASVVGIDPNKENCKVARESGLNVINDYPERVSSLDDSFDIATCFEVIEHLYDHHGITLSMSRMLRAGGVAVISTPNAFNIMRQFKFLFSHEHHDSLMDPTRTDYPEHIRLWSYGMMLRICNKEKDLHVQHVYGASNIFGRVMVFKNKFLIQFLAQHLIVIIKKS